MEKVAFWSKFWALFGTLSKIDFCSFWKYFLLFFSQTTKVLEFCKRFRLWTRDLGEFWRIDKKEWLSFSGLAQTQGRDGISNRTQGRILGSTSPKLRFPILWEQYKCYLRGWLSHEYAHTFVIICYYKTPKSIRFQWKKPRFVANIGHCLGPYKKSRFAHFENIFYLFYSQSTKVLEFCKRIRLWTRDLRKFDELIKKSGWVSPGLNKLRVEMAFLTALRVELWGLQAQTYVSPTSGSNINVIWGSD